MSTLDGGAFQPSTPNIDLLAQGLTEGAFQDPAKVVAQQPQGIRPLSDYMSDVARDLSAVRQASVEQQMVTSLRVSSQIDPNTAGETQRIASRLGIDPSAASSQLQIAEELDREKQIKMLELAKKYPVMSNQLADINFANIAHDSLQNLYKTEGAFQKLSAPYEKGQLTNDLGYLGAKMLAARLGGEPDSPKDERRAAWMNRRLQEMGESSGIYDNVVEVIGQMSSTIPAVIASGWLGGKAGALTGTPQGAAIGAAVGTGTAVFTQAAVIEGGNAYLDMVSMGLDPDAAASAAIGVGLVNGALELVGEELTFGLATGARKMLSKQITKAVAESMIQKTGSRAVGKFVKQYVIGGAAEVMTEILQEVTNIKAEQYARGETYGPTGEPMDTTERLIAIAKKTALAMVVLGGVGPGQRLMLDAHEARAGVKRAQHFKDIQQAATDDKVKDRNPEAYRAAVQAAADGNDVGTLHVEGEALGEVLRSLKITPDELAQQYPELAAQIPKIVAGETVEIPTGVYQEKIARTDLGKELVRHIKIDPETLSLAESEEVLANLPSMAEEAAKVIDSKAAEDDAFVKSAKQLEDMFVEQLVATGIVQKTQAKTIASLYRDFAVVHAAQEQMLPMDWHAQSGVRFAGVEQQAVTPEAAPSVAPTQEAVPTPEVAIPSEQAPTPTEPVAAAPKPSQPLASRKSVKVAGSYNPATRVIDLSQASNAGPETIIHELGHFYLETLMDAAYLNIADIQDGTEFVMDSMSSKADPILRFLGVKGGTVIERIKAWQDMTPEQRQKPHELFAYSLEQYMWTNQAPNEELRSVFQEIMRWFRRAYATLRDIARAYKAETSIINLNAKLKSGAITPEQHALDMADIEGGNFDKYGEELPALTRDVRMIFDRMFASEQDIRRTMQVRAFVAAFQTKEEFLKAGNSEADWDEYRKMLADADFEAYDLMMKKSLANVRWLSRAKAKEMRERADKHRELRARVKAEVEEELRASPVNRARTWLKTGRILNEDGITYQDDVDENHSLNTEAVEEYVNLDAFQAGEGEEVDAKTIRKYLKVSGQHPNTVAPFFGFENGAQMVLALIKEPSFKNAVEAKTDARMLAEHADYVDGTKEHAAAIDSAIHNEARARMVAAQLSFVSKGKRPWRIMLASARLAAREQLERMPISEISARKFSIAEAKASRKLAEATKKGETQSALDWARKELLQNQLATQAHEIKEEVEKALKLFSKFFKKDEKLSKSRDMSLVMAGRAILSAYGVGPDGMLPMDHVAKLKEYNNDVYQEILPLITRALANVSQVLDYRKDMSFGEFMSLKDSLQSLWEESLSSKQIEIAGQKVSLDAAVAELNARLEKIGLPKVERKSADDSAKFSRKFRSAKAHLRRVEHWADAMGPEFTKYIWGRIKAGTDKYTDDSRKYLSRYVDAMRSLKLTHEEIVSGDDELNWTFNSKSEIIGLLLHSGNMSNLRKLLLGRFGNDSIEDVEARFQDALSRYRKFLDRMFAEGKLTEADVRFVQSVHALTNDLRPLLQEAHWNRFGRHFKEVEMSDFATPYGAIRGYVPATTDSFLVRQASSEVSLEEQADEFLKRIPSVPSSMVKERVETYWKELSLDVRLIGKHINDTLLFVHMGSAVGDVLKILNHPEFAKKMDAFDPVAVKEMLMPWLQTVAKQTGSRRGSIQLMDQFWNGLRKRSAMMALIGNIANAVQQATGLFPAMLKVNPGNLMNALWTVTRSPRDTAKFIAEKSKFMRELMDNKIQHLRRDVNDILTNPSKLQQLGEWSESHTMFLLNAVQNPVSMATWLGAYNQSLAQSSASMDEAEAEAEAIRAADAAVSMTQGSSAPQDVPRIQTGTPFHQAMMQFIGYFNMLANLNATEFQKVLRESGWKNNKGKVLSRGFAIYMLGFALPGLISDAIARTFAGQWGEEGDDDDMTVMMDWFFGSQFRSVASMVPVIGPAVAAGVRYGIGGRPMDAHMPLAPSMRLIENMYGAIGATRKLVIGEKEITGSNIRDWASALSVILDVPLTLATTPLSYAYDVESGKVEPQEYLGLPPEMDYLRGLLTGQASKGSTGR